MPTLVSGSQSHKPEASGKLAIASLVHYEQAFFIRQIIAASIPIVWLISRDTIPVRSLVPAFYVVVAATGLNLLYYWLTVTRRFRAYFKWAQIAIDMLLWTVLVHLTGGSGSVFFFLYPLEILVGAFTLSASGCIYGAGVASLFYSVEAGVFGPHPGLDGNNLVKVIFLVGVAALTVVIVRKLEVKTREIQRLGEEQRERAEKAEISLSTLLDTVSSGLLILGADGELLSVNDPLARMLGSEAQPASIGESVSPALAVLRGRLMTMLKRRQVENDFTLSSADRSGRRRNLCVHARVFELRGQKRIMAVISEDGGGEDEEAGVARVERGADASVLGKGDSVSVVAHEVKNSMACVLGFLSLLKEDVARDARSVELLRKAVGAVEELDAFVNDLLLYSRCAAPQFEPTDIVSLVDSIAGCLEEESFRDKKVVLSRQFAVQRLDAEVDERQIRHVVTNLLLNAYQAVEQGGRVCLSVRREDGCAVVEVADDGCGIPQEIMKRLFEPFFTTRKYGNGLGLSIARNFVDAHHGRISIKSNPGCGTNVRVCLPVEQAETDSEGVVESPGALSSTVQ